LPIKSIQSTFSLRLRVSLVAALVMCAGCPAPLSPSAAFDKMAKAGEDGDREAFLAGLSQASRDALDGVLAVAGEHPGRVRLGKMDATVRAVSFTSPQPEIALVLVETTDSPPQRAQVVMRLEDGAWRLDLLSTELLWNRDWELSGGAPRRGGWFEVDSLDNQGSLP
jgi:hypothetical protein